MTTFGIQLRNPFSHLTRPESQGKEGSSGRIRSITLAALGIALLIALTGCSQPESQPDDQAVSQTNQQVTTEPPPSFIECSESPADTKPQETRADTGPVENISNVANIASAAEAFISTLSEEQLAQAMYAFGDPVRSNWSNLPAGRVDFERNGVRIGDMSAVQVDAMQEFLATALSPDGSATVMGIVGADAELEKSLQSFLMKWDDENYWLAFFGEPSEQGTWGWQFGGHHLAVNVTVSGGRSYLSPTFLGVEPAQYESEGVVTEPLARHAAAGLAVIQSLEGELRSSAIVSSRPDETLAGAGKDGVIPGLEGSPTGAWTDCHRAKLLYAISLWTGLLPEPDAAARLEEIRAELDQLHFAWNGEVDGSGEIYYRIQGSSLIIEFSTQGSVGADGGHYHSVYRDPTNEYGKRAAPAGS